jgi:CspA family cold shock protein
MRTGTIARLVSERGFGFIKDDATGQEFFFHARDVTDRVFAVMKVGHVVTFDVVNGEKGPRAANVSQVRQSD